MSTRENPDDQYLELLGFVHEVDMTPTGSAEDPWPFMLSSNDGHHTTHVMVYREHAEQLVEFLTRHLSSEEAK